MREREDRGGGSRSMHSSVKVSDTAVQPEWSYLQKKARQIIEHQCSLCNRIMRPRERERERDREREMGTAVVYAWRHGGEGEAGEEHRKVGLGLAMMQMRGSTVPVVVYRPVEFGGGAFLGQLWMPCLQMMASALKGVL